MMTCPKCGTDQPAAAACRKCGLAAGRMAGFREANPEAPPAVLAAWAACEAGWDEPARHDRFAAAVVDGNAFAYAARQYKAVLAARPDDAIAAAQLARQQKMTEAALLATAVQRPETGPTPYRAPIIILGVCIVLVVFGLLYVVMTRSTSGEMSPAPRPVPAQNR